MRIAKMLTFMSIFIFFLFVTQVEAGRSDFRELMALLNNETVTTMAEATPTPEPEDLTDPGDLPDPEDLQDFHHIPIMFFVHEEPCFMSPIVAEFNAQYVEVLERADGGWGTVSVSDDVTGWAYLPGNRVFVPYTTGLYEYVGGTSSLGTISPQVVDILDAQGSWRLLDTFAGKMWVDLAFRPPTDELDAFLRPFGTSVAVFYMNIETGFTYMFNPDITYFTASLNKIKHALYLFTLAERGQLDLNRVHTYNPGDYREGTGRIRTRYSFGTQFTTRELLYYSIRFSDNVAFRMLFRQYGLSGFLEFAREIGANESLIGNLTGANVTARDSGLWMLAVHNYLESGGSYTELFRSDLLNTNMTLVQANHPVASKYGWARPSFHEMAIVYADSPYILVILSTLYQGPVGGSNTFANISRRFEQFHRTYFG